MNNTLYAIVEAREHGEETWQEVIPDSGDWSFLDGADWCAIEDYERFSDRAGAIKFAKYVAGDNKIAQVRVMECQDDGEMGEMDEVYITKEKEAREWVA